MLRRAGGLLEEAMRLWELCDLGFIRNLDDVTPQGYVALSFMRAEMRHQQMVAQADLIGNRLADVFGRKKQG